MKKNSSVFPICITDTIVLFIARQLFQKTACFLKVYFLGKFNLKIAFFYRIFENLIFEISRYSVTRVTSHDWEPY